MIGVGFDPCALDGDVEPARVRLGGLLLVGMEEEDVCRLWLVLKMSLGVTVLGVVVGDVDDPCTSKGASV